MKPRVRLSLPPLSPAEALALSRVLDRIDDALWRYYGQQMTTLLDPEANSRALAGSDNDFEQPAVKERGR